MRLPVNCVNNAQNSTQDEGAWARLQGHCWPCHEAGGHAPDVPLTGHPGTGNRACTHAAHKLQLQAACRLKSRSKPSHVPLEALHAVPLLDL